MRPGLVKIRKTVQGKKGPHERSYWVKAGKHNPPPAPQAQSAAPNAKKPLAKVKGKATPPPIPKKASPPPVPTKPAAQPDAHKALGPLPALTPLPKLKQGFLARVWEKLKGGVQKTGQDMKAEAKKELSKAKEGIKSLKAKKRQMETVDRHVWDAASGRMVRKLS